MCSNIGSGGAGGSSGYKGGVGGSDGAVMQRGGGVKQFLQQQYGIDIDQYRDEFTRKYDSKDSITLDITNMSKNDRNSLYSGQEAYGKINYVVSELGKWGVQIYTGTALDDWKKGMDKIWGKGKWTVSHYHN